eukprot:TRINITY_DN8454_c0_g1_i1.p1 TRINITY_DN8454_c0_g1~~TRINITY_DN8454_c0_g1_i1.p1  ORF type:complete len:259 (+),score=43.06 TRINITY_DN8454_c0_g1_i1:96-872(+)
MSSENTVRDLQAEEAPKLKNSTKKAPNEAPSGPADLDALMIYLRSKIVDNFTWDQKDLHLLSTIHTSNITTTQAEHLYEIVNAGFLPHPIPKGFSRLLDWLEGTRPQCNDLQFRDGTADEVMETILSVPQNPAEWSENDIANLLKQFRGLATIDCQLSSKKSLEIYDQFIPKWSEYLEHHPEIAAKLDPYYVIVDFGGAGQPQDWPCGYPGVKGVTMNGKNYALSFKSTHDAYAWAGYMRAVGFRSWVIKTTIPVMYM